MSIAGIEHVHVMSTMEQFSGGQQTDDAASDDVDPCHVRFVPAHDPNCTSAAA